MKTDIDIICEYIGVAIAESKYKFKFNTMHNAYYEYDRYAYFDLFAPYLPPSDKYHSIIIHISYDRATLEFNTSYGNVVQAVNLSNPNFSAVFKTQLEQMYEYQQRTTRNVAMKEQHNDYNMQMRQ